MLSLLGQALAQPAHTLVPSGPGCSQAGRAKGIEEPNKCRLIAELLWAGAVGLAGELGRTLES